MAEYEKDFMLRQAKQMADLLGSFMDKESVEDIMEMDQEQGQKLRQEKHKQLIGQLSNQVNETNQKKIRPLIKKRLVE